MANDLREIFKKKIVPVTFERTMGLFGAVTIGVGALMGAGVYVLIGIASGAAGPAVWLSYVICGGLAFLTTLMYADFSKIVSKSGGGFVYAYDSLGSIGGFVTGWFLALGSIFACGLYAIGFADYFTALLGYDLERWVVIGIAIGLVLLSTFINAKGADSDSIQKILTWGNLCILLALIAFSTFKINMENYTPMYPKGIGGMGAAISIIYISFFGYQLIANNSDEIHHPTKTVPRAMILAMLISFAIYLLISVVSIGVISWDKLAESNAPLVLVAEKSFGGWGWIIISIGGVLAAASALNSTLLSQGRQIYAMGKNRFFPDALGKINEKNRTPQAALIAGGGLVVLVLSFLELEFIAKSANFCLLASLIPVSLALRKVYRQDKSKRPKNLFKRHLPEITLVANFGLLLTLDWLSLTFGLQLALVGAVIFYFYSRKRETRSRSGMNIVLDEKRETSFLLTGSRILVPMANPKTQRAIFNVSNAMLNQVNGEIVVLSVVKASKQTDFYSALSENDVSLDLLERSAEMAEMTNIPLKPLVRVSHSIAKGIVHAAQDQSCNLIIMGYAGRSSKGKSDLMHEVLHYANTDVIFLKLDDKKHEFEPQKIGVALGGRINLELMVDLAGALAKKFNGTITFISILPEEFTSKQKSNTDRTIIEAIQRHKTRTLYNAEIYSSSEPLDLLIKKSTEYDLLIVGTTKVGLFKDAVVGTFATQLAENASCHVAVVRVVGSAKKIIQKM